MKLKKLLALFMAAMMLCAFVGCGEKDVKIDPPVRIEPDIALMEYVYHDKDAPESCGYLYLPKCDDADIAAYLASADGRAATLAAAKTYDTANITFSELFTIVQFEGWEDGGDPIEGEVMAGVQIYSAGVPPKMTAIVNTAEGKFYHTDFPEPLPGMACFAQSSEDKPVVFGVGMGSCALYDGKIYGLHYFNHRPLTVKHTNLLRDFTAKEFIKIEVKQW